VRVETVVTPNARAFGLEYVAPYLRVWVRSPPEKGEANKELVKELSRALGCEVRILGGVKSRKKLLEHKVRRVCIIDAGSPKGGVPHFVR